MKTDAYGNAKSSTEILVVPHISIIAEFCYLWFIGEDTHLPTSDYGVMYLRGVCISASIDMRVSGRDAVCSAQVLDHVFH